MDVVVVKDICKRVSPCFCIRDISFAIGQGEFVALVGRNGAGKTTLLRTICGLLGAFDGESRLLGRSPRSIKRLAALVGIVHQHTSLPEFLTVEECLRTEGSLRQYDPRMLERALSLMQLEPYRRKRIRELSEGTKRKVAISKALIHQPRLLLLDEPTMGLDPFVRAEIQRAFLRWKRDGLTMLFATHDLAEVQMLCDRVIVLDEGQLVAEYVMSELTDQGRSLVDVLSPGSQIIEPRLTHCRAVTGEAHS